MKQRWLYFFLVLLVVASGCAREYVGEDPPTDRLHFPIGLDIRPDGEAALVVSSNFDLGFNRGAVHAVDLNRVAALIAAGGGRAEAPIEDALRGSVFVPSFGGQLRFVPGHDHAFLVNRQESTLVELELTGSSDQLSVRCGNRDGDTPDCTDGDHVLQLEGGDAYSLLVQASGDRGARVFAGSLAGGTVSAVNAQFDLEGASRLTLPYVVESELIRASGIAYLPGTPLNPPYLLVVGELRPEGEILGSPGANLRVYSEGAGSFSLLGSWPLVGATQALDARAIALGPDFSRAYVAQRYPDSVAAVDLTLGESGLPRFRTITAQSVGRQPTALAVDPDATEGPLVLVVCFAEEALYALDASTLEVRSVLHNLRGGPAEITLDLPRSQAYVTLFSDDTIAVIALDRPDHPGLEEVARVGQPRPQPAESFSLDPYQWF